MKIRTTSQLFDHDCQIKDMKLAGFSPSGLRYLCIVCGGQFVLRLARERWEKAFGENPSFRLTPAVLEQLTEQGAEPVEDEEALKQATAEMQEPDPQRFRWVPDDEANV